MIFLVLVYLSCLSACASASLPCHGVHMASAPLLNPSSKPSTHLCAFYPSECRRRGCVEIKGRTCVFPLMSREERTVEQCAAVPRRQRLPCGVPDGNVTACVELGCCQIRRGPGPHCFVPAEASWPPAKSTVQQAPLSIVFNAPTYLSRRIPPMLFQTWYTRTPRGWVGRMLQQTSRINPDMSLWLFDNQDVDAFVKLEFPSVWRSVWPHLHGAYRIQRYDLFRLLVVLRYGGVYYDIDMETLYPVSPLLRRHSAVFAVEEVVPQDACRQGQRQTGRWLWHDCRTPLPMLGNYAFAARQGHPFLALLVDTFLEEWRAGAWERREHEDRETYILSTLGPDFVSRVWHSLTLEQRVNMDVFLLVPESRPHFSHFGPYARHYMRGTWRVPTLHDGPPSDGITVVHRGAISDRLPGRPAGTPHHTEL